MGSGKKGEIFSEINITPLTDIFLVLLIIMMVIAPLLDQQGLNLAVPELGAPPDQQQKELKTITVDINESGTLMVNNEPVTMDKLPMAVNKLFKTNKDGLVIRVHPNSKHQEVVKVMDIARAQGITSVSVSSM